MKIKLFLLALLLSMPSFAQALKKATIPVVPPIYRVANENYCFVSSLDIDESGLVTGIRLSNSNNIERDLKFAQRVFSKWQFESHIPGSLDFKIEIHIMPTNLPVLPEAELEPSGTLRIFAWKLEKTSDPIVQK
ncbi:hypothetical protein [Geothrix oryzae]|uniref:hypothetical protein n=1 Tax=Geothrix oryzae TaxID=2927975 RepID=UPI002573099F|nr:hypothetical protein [Geothrix oryzae]